MRNDFDYNANDNLIDDGEDYEYVYDAFGRLKEVRKTSNQALVAEYRYNGLGFRVGWHYDTDADTDVDGSDVWFYFAYDESWRIVAVYRASDTSPKEQFVHHMAGLGGYGGSSYIDGVILRDRDANTAWAEAADGVLEERLNYCQNWRADVVAIVTSAGKLVEWVKYSSYGVPFALPTGDTDSDGDWDVTDRTAILTGGYDVRKDADLDGDADTADITYADSITGGYQTLGREKLTSAAINNRIAYAGYQYDPTFNGLDRHLSHVRFRVYDAELGRWTRRDPLGYVDGMGLYEYVSGAPAERSDPHGLSHAPAAAGPPTEDRVYECVQRSTSLSGCKTTCCDSNPAYRTWCYQLCEQSQKEREQESARCIPFPTVPGCPPTAPGPGTGDNWCLDSLGGGHCGLTCYRSYGTRTRSGQQCCYDKSGALVTDQPDCMGSVDLEGCADGENSDGTCTFDVIKCGRHRQIDVRPWKSCKRLYNEMQCCMRQFIPSGTPPGPGRTTDADVDRVLKLCRNEVYERGKTFCKPPSTAPCNEPNRPWRPIPPGDLTRIYW